MSHLDQMVCFDEVKFRTVTFIHQYKSSPCRQITRLEISTGKSATALDLSAQNAQALIALLTQYIVDVKTVEAEFNALQSIADTEVIV